MPRHVKLIYGQEVTMRPSDRELGGVLRDHWPPGRADLPKYQQIRIALMEAIRSGRWAEGARLPTEEELVALTGCSLGTVQRAVRMLADDGILLRRQGSGTFVASASWRISEPWHFQFFDEDSETLLPAYPKVLAREWTKQRGPWTRFLGAASASLLRIDRAINVNHEFTAFSRFFVAGDQAKLMEALPVDELHGANFRLLLCERCRMPIARIEHAVSLVQATGELARQVRTPRKEALLRVEIRATAVPGEPFYFQELFSPPTTRKLWLPNVGRS
ncbi:MAG: GntR family transcriptional regulator [Hyphomicrobiaceae bacterium]|nr:GntR family transcriptional regulator [Hyphomicrobiaceae bacterium]